MVLAELEVPIVLAPLAGGPSTPELTAAVVNAGAFGFLAAGYLSVDETAERIRATRELTEHPFGVNLFVPAAGPTPEADYADFANRLAAWAQRKGLALGEPRFSDDDYEAKVELLLRERVTVVSFTFGCPDRSVLERLRRAGCQAWVTVTSPAEAELAARAGADALIVQGAEAGGHQASFEDRLDLAPIGLLSLLKAISARRSLPLVASGGIATGAAIAAALSAGAAATQLGTAFLLCPEAGTSAPHREAIRAGGETRLTRAFTGRLARGLRNAFLDEHTAFAPVAYPEIHYLTAPIRAKARSEGDSSLINLWAGEAHRLARELPAAELVEALHTEARAALNQ